MKAFVFPIFFAFAALLSAQENGTPERDFTNLTGKTIRASVVRIEGKNVLLKVGGETYPVPIATLVEDDKTFLKAWLAEHPSYAFRFASYHRAGASPLGGSLAPVAKPEGIPGQPSMLREVAEDDFHYDLIVTNDSGVDLKDVEVHYRVFVKCTKRGEFSGIYFDQIGGVTRVPLIKPGPGNLVQTGTVSLVGTRDTKVSAETVEIRSSTGSNIVTLKKVTRESERSEPAGVWVRLYHNGQMIKEYQDLGDEVAKRKPVWDEKCPMIEGVRAP